MNETLYLVIPCYNEQEVLPETARRLDEKLGGMIAVGIVSKDSRVLFVDDGSRDTTWKLSRACIAKTRAFGAEAVAQPGASKRACRGVDGGKAIL